MSSIETFSINTNTEDFGPLPPAENKRFYPALNGLRAIAVLMVFSAHYLVALHPALNWGWIGVNLFFVLSGFLITGILFDTRNKPNRFRNFYARRALRIFPLYYAVLLVALLLYPIFRWQHYRSWIFLPLYLQNFVHLLGMNNFVSTRPTSHSFSLIFGHFWSLAVEEQFYFFWPFVVFSVKKLTTLRNICLLTFLALTLLKLVCAILLPASFLEPTLFLYRFTPFCMDALFLGGLLAVFQRGTELARLTRFLWPAFYISFFSFGGFLVLYAILHKHPFFPFLPGFYMSTLGFFLVNIICGIVILVCLQPDTWLYRLLCLKPLRILGEISYGFYIFHDMFHLELINLCHYQLHLSQVTTERVITPVALLLTIGISLLSFRFLETPFLRLKSRF